MHGGGAFGLWAAVSPSLAHLAGGTCRVPTRGRADAHKTLNVQDDCGIAIVADSHALRSTFGEHAHYLISDETGVGDPSRRSPSCSPSARRARMGGAARSLGRSGAEELIHGLVHNAKSIADGLGDVKGATVLNDVVYTQVCVAFESDERMREVAQRIIADGATWMSGSRWKGRAVLRVSVSNWSTDDDDVRQLIDAVRRAAAGRVARVVLIGGAERAVERARPHGLSSVIVQGGTT